MPRISDEELNLALTNWKFAAAIKMDLRRQWANEFAEDLRDARKALAIAVEGLELVADQNDAAYPKQVARTYLDRIKQKESST